MFRVARQNLLAFFVAISFGSICGMLADRILKTTDAVTDEVVAESETVAVTQISPQSATDEKIDQEEQQRKTCTDSEVRPVWNAIRRNKKVKDALDDAISPSDCRAAFEIGYFDLNGDGKKEVFARAIGIPFCGAVGNCDLFILKRTIGGLRLLLHADDQIDLANMGEQISRRSTNGYLDITTKGHFSASETSFTTYKFNGSRYVETGCKYQVPEYDRSGRLSWELISCKEFYRRLDRDLKQSDHDVNRR